ncbi:hypothetical protein M413DRAFT_450007 [Hebeloma cylindrosporum]|uniref:Uncharacterized protein n=1 Tax=Hebeloma cylindrosporum TaxID=76867 RepID=A0A0C3BU56_HEBCY|nr:hypothetical protein M413DRAFT_450007 [Hebeloma cylindrosporum h7]
MLSPSSSHALTEACRPLSFDSRLYCISGRLAIPYVVLKEGKSAMLLTRVLVHGAVILEYRRLVRSIPTPILFAATTQPRPIVDEVDFVDDSTASTLDPTISRRFTLSLSCIRQRSHAPANPHIIILLSSPRWTP